MHIDQFIKEYSSELVAGTASYFVGSGISVPSHLPDWTGLLEPYARKIGITDLKDKDMPLIAQYVINEETGNRGPFINAISRKLRKRFFPNSYHDSITKTNLKTIWTTNYDNLLETAFGSYIIDVKMNDDAISREVPDAQVEIIKMHGCIFNSHRKDIVITQSDYEDFFINKPATAQRMKVDLLQKSFLFIGYGYRDPNIQNIVTEARRLSENNTRQHYLVTIRLNTREFELWSDNLRRYGIQVVPIEEHAELNHILRRLALESRSKSVFITGSHDDNLDSDARSLAEALAMARDIVLNDGQSTGIMRTAASAYMEKVIERKFDIEKRLQFFPNPYAANASFANDLALIPTLKQWRAPLFRSTQVVIAFDGQMGTQAEIELALEFGCIVIPYFKDKSKVVWNFLKNMELIDRLKVYDAGYIQKVEDGKVLITDVIALVKKIFP